MAFDFRKGLDIGRIIRVRDKTRRIVPAIIDEIVNFEEGTINVTVFTPYAPAGAYPLANVVYGPDKLTANSWHWPDAEVARQEKGQ